MHCFPKDTPPHTHTHTNTHLHKMQVNNKAKKDCIAVFFYYITSIIILHNSHFNQMENCCLTVFKTTILIQEKELVWNYMGIFIVIFLLLLLGELYI